MGGGGRRTEGQARHVGAGVLAAPRITEAKAVHGESGTAGMEGEEEEGRGKDRDDTWAVAFDGPPHHERKGDT